MTCRSADVKTVRVDCLGPPGVGKSTLCRAILGHPENTRRKRAVALEWISIEEAHRLAARNACRRHIPRMSVSRRLRVFLRLLLHGTINYLLRGYSEPFYSGELEKLKKNLLVKFLEQYHPFVEAVTEQWFDPDMVLPSVAVRYNDLLPWTMNWLFSMTWAGPVRILADNSRFTRGIAELLSNEEYGSAAGNTAVAECYCRSPMGPSGLVHVEADASTIVARIHHRESKMNGWRYAGHQNLSDVELLAYSKKRSEVNATAVKFFLSQGIPVLTLLASAPLDENVKAVQGFLAEVVAQEKADVSSSQVPQPVVVG